MKRNLNIKEAAKKRIQIRHQKYEFNNMNDRNLRRIQTTNNTVNLPSIENRRYDDQFSIKYEKNLDVYYDTIILITSYDRYDLVYNLLNQIFSQKTKYTYKVILVDDGSKDIKYKTLTKKFPELIYIKNETNLGKQLYWQTINNGLQEARKYTTNSILQIDDDFQLCNNFLNKLITLYYNKKNENNRILCISYHLYDESHLTESRWNLKYWVDGGGLYDIEFIKLIQFQIDGISEIRWKNFQNLSTGVWRQMSQKINNLGCIIIKTSVSYVNHLGFHSKMWTGGKIDGGEIKTYKFIDDENVE